jgi:two-component system sensor histidine kinase PilS (NtrC family)
MRPLRGQSAALGGNLLAGRILLHTGTQASGPEISALPRPDSPGFYASHWRSLDYFNLYRLTLAAIFAVLSLLVTPDWLVGNENPPFFRIAAFGYLAASAMFVLGIRARWPSFPVQLSLHIFTDIIFITALANASGGVSSGLGLLLLASLASAGLVGQGRLALMYASMAALAMLGMHTFRIWSEEALPQDYLQTALLSVGYFAIAWLAHILTRRALVLEQVAAGKARELALLNRIHALAAGDSINGIIAFTQSGNVTYCNAQACAMLGKDPAQGKPVSVRGMFEKTSRMPNQAGELEMDLPGGRVRLRFLPIEDSGHTVLLLEDLSRAEKLAQQIKLASLGRLTLNIAHEIRNPLSAIGHAAQLLDEETPPGSSSKLTGIIHNNIQRLDLMVQDILTLNRRDRQERENINTAVFMENWIREWRQAEEIPENAVIVDMKSNATVCFAPQHMRQILWNLTRNAWRHSRRQAGSVRLLLQAGSDELQLEICDDGPGVSPEIQAQLFEPFFTTDAQGTGLGLFIARELAEANGARLEFGGNRPGACFRLSLPKRPC